MAESETLKRTRRSNSYTWTCNTFTRAIRLLRGQTLKFVVAFCGRCSGIFIIARVCVCFSARITFGFHLYAAVRLLGPAEALWTPLSAAPAVIYIILKSFLIAAKSRAPEEEGVNAKGYQLMIFDAHAVVLLGGDVISRGGGVRSTATALTVQLIHCVALCRMLGASWQRPPNIRWLRDAACRYTYSTTPHSTCRK